MYILGIETSDRTFSVALSSDDRVISEIFIDKKYAHSEKIVPEIDRLLNDMSVKLNELERIAVSIGPGSFTGIRVGMSCARVLAQSLDIKIAAADTLTILENNLPFCSAKIIPVIDALRNEVYIKRKGRIVIVKANDFIESLNDEKDNTVVLGSGAVKYRQDIEKLRKKNIILTSGYINYPGAGTLCLMSSKMKALPYSSVKPLYIRKSWAEENRKDVKGKSKT